MSGFAQIQEFFVEGRNNKTSHVLLHISEPSTAEELPKGSLFALIEITGGTPEQIEELQNCIDEVEQKYYTQVSDNPEELFEKILEYVNRKSHYMLQGGAVDAVIGVMVNSTILLSYHGTPSAYVFYQHKQEYKTLSIISEPEENNSQLFSSVLSGSIHMHDYFFVSTPSVSRYFSADRIQKIITARDAEGGAIHLQRTLANLRSDISFGGIVTKLISIHDLPKTGKIPPHLKQGSKDSIYGLVEAQDNTSETLNPSWLQSAKSLFSTKPQTQTETRKKQATTTIDEAEESTTPFIISFLHGIGIVLLTLSTLALTIFESISIIIRDTAVTLWYLITNHRNKRNEIINNFTNALVDKKRSFIQLPLLNKILLIGTILMVCVFVGSIVVYDINKKQVARDQVYALTLSNIQSKYQKAQAQITYNDITGALGLLKEAINETENLPENTDERQDTKQTLTTSLNALLSQVRNITIVTPTLLASITSSTERIATPNQLARVQNNLIAFGQNDTFHYIIPVVGGTVETRDHSSLPSLLSASTPKENDTVIFLGTANSVSALDIHNQTISSKTIAYPQPTAAPLDIALYNRRAYILDPINNQIYKHSPTASGYDKGTPWIQTQLEGTNIANGIALAIDGDIFVLTTDGNVQKYVAGAQEQFIISGLDPALDKPTKIFTYTDVNYIYILEPTYKRVVVLDKTGKLIRQYTATEWQNPTGMSIDEKNKIGYILDSNIVYSFSL